MSILPSKNQGAPSSSSPSTSFQSPTPNHGFFPVSSRPQLQRLSEPSIQPQTSGQAAPAVGCSSEYFEGVNQHKDQNHGKTPVHPNAVYPAAVGTSDLRGRSSGMHVSSSSRSAVSSRDTGTLTSKRTHMVSGNHLLNFRYDHSPVSRSQPRAPPPRRQHKRKSYDKDLFFQANYKFVVLDSGCYAPKFTDPDKMLHWEEIICLMYSTPSPVLCPICLDDPLCPQITSCGHIFCFPCILQYFSIGEDDDKAECLKKCPLCFTMISSKDLHTIQIENVKQYHIGDEIDFVLLTRQKDSFSSSLKNNEGTGIDEEILDSFSKFTLTSDVELSVRAAMSDLDSWIARADSGLVDDIEKLPYVCVAMEQLEQRKKYWNEHRVSNGNNASISPDGSPPTRSDSVSNSACVFAGATSANKNEKLNFSEESTPRNVGGEFCSPQAVDNKNAHLRSNGIKDNKDGDFYNFYQAVDGQNLILHPLNMKCLLHHYGSYERLPNRITGKILQMETVTQSEAMRRRYRFLSHFSLTTSFQLCEIDLSDTLPAESLSPFIDEIKNRQKQRKQLARKENKDKMKAEIAASQFVPFPYYPQDGSPNFSSDDFEALGSSPVVVATPSTSFSSVARLGFAAAHDSPASLRMDEIQTRPKHESSSSSDLVSQAGSLSFANIASRATPAEGPQQVPRPNEVVKKGKKSSRVLLSTAGGRRY